MYSSEDMHKTFSILRALGDGDPERQRRKLGEKATLTVFLKIKAKATIPEFVSLTEVGFPERNKVITGKQQNTILGGLHPLETGLIHEDGSA